MWRTKLESILKEINKDRAQLEAPFIFCLWKEPDLYDDYRMVNEGKDETIRSDDGKFYYMLGKVMKQQGYSIFDNITINNYLNDKPALKKRFDSYGGYKVVEQFKKLVNTDNVEGYFDKVAKLNTLDSLCRTYYTSFNDMSKFKNMTNQDVYDFFEYHLNNISLSTGHEIKIEDLVIDDAFIEDCNKGDVVGLNYGKACPLLNYLTLGAPLGELFMIAGHSGVGKSSFAFENMILPFIQEGKKAAVISNEMRSKDYKHLLLVHILTHDLDYWDLTRKRLKMGNFSEEELAMIRKAQKISKEKYGNIRFVKLFDNEMSKVLKFIKKLSKVGYQAFVWDTMKSDDSVDEVMWQQLMLNSRRIFQLASKENVSIITTYQLALHTSNQRFLDAGCLSNSKQIKEVFSEMFYLRQLWEDEYTGQRNDCQAFKFKKREDGTYNTKQATMITLDPNKKYIVGFLDKTRNDEDKKQIVYEWNGRFNTWKEIGYCKIINEHIRV